MYDDNTALFLKQKNEKDHFEFILSTVLLADIPSYHMEFGDNIFNAV